MILDKIICYGYSLPLQNPLRLSQSTLEFRRGIILKFHTNDGYMALGEIAPLPGFSRETFEEASSQAHKLAVFMVGKSCEEAYHVCFPNKPLYPSVDFGFRSALQWLFAQKSGLSVHRFLNEGAPESITVCRLLDDSSCSADPLTNYKMLQGCTVIKIKVGRRPISEEVNYVRKILDLLPHSVKVRLDANRAWSLDEALAFCMSIPTDRIEFLEEPTVDFHNIPLIQNKTGLACAVDETLQDLSHNVLSASIDHVKSHSPDLYGTVEQAQYHVWKPSLCLPLPLVGVPWTTSTIISGAFESGVGTAIQLHYAAAFMKASYAAGVDTYSRLRKDVFNTPLPLDRNVITLDTIDACMTTFSESGLDLLWYV